MRILVIEDERTIAENIRKYLSKSSITVDIESSYTEGKFQAESESYDVYIIDWMLPDGNGVKLASEIRAMNATPILMLTAKSQTDDIIDGLNAGADDYLTKPFSLAELLARINALIRRKNGPSVSPIIKIGDVTIDTNTRRVHVQDTLISLAPREYLLLEYMALHPNIAVDRMELLSHVWGDDIDPLSNTVDVHIRYLRTKLGEPLSKTLIQTIKGKGYMLCANLPQNSDSL